MILMKCFVYKKQNKKTLKSKLTNDINDLFQGRAKKKKKIR